MKRARSVCRHALLALVFGSGAVAFVSATANAADKPAAKAEAKPDKAAAAKKGEEVTLKGTLGCGKCAFHTSDKCSNVLKVKDAAGKETAYELADTAVAQEHHVCGGTKEVTVTGTVSEKAGKKVLTASEIKS
jgi:hypothetical protein